MRTKVPGPVRVRLQFAALDLVRHELRGLFPIIIVPLKVDRIWLWVYFDTIPIYPIFYLLKGDYRAVVNSNSSAGLP